MVAVLPRDKLRTALPTPTPPTSSAREPDQGEEQRRAVDEALDAGGRHRRGRGSASRRRESVAFSPSSQARVERPAAGAGDRPSRSGCRAGPGPVPSGCLGHHQPRPEGEDARCRGRARGRWRRGPRRSGVADADASPTFRPSRSSRFAIDDRAPTPVALRQRVGEAARGAASTVADRADRRARPP